MDLFNKLSLPALCQLLGTFMPIIKLKQENSYLIGTEKKMMMVRGEKCMVRVGGGFADIVEYYNNYATKQCVSLYQIMNSTNCTFKQAIHDLMEKNVASPESIEAYEIDDESWDSANFLFCLLATTVEERSTEEKRRSTKKKSKKGKKGAAGHGNSDHDYSNDF